LSPPCTADVSFKNGVLKVIPPKTAEARSKVKKVEIEVS